MELAFHARPYHIGSVFRRKNELHANGNEGLGHGVVGPFQGPISFCCRIVRGRCPRLRYESPFRAASLLADRFVEIGLGCPEVGQRLVVVGIGGFNSGLLLERVTQECRLLLVLIRHLA